MAAREAPISASFHWRPGLRCETSGEPIMPCGLTASELEDLTAGMEQQRLAQQQQDDGRRPPPLVSVCAARAAGAAAQEGEQQTPGEPALW